MLSDDITGTMRSILSGTRSVLSGAIRGALIGLAIAFVVGTVAVAWPLGAAAVAGGGGFLTVTGGILAAVGHGIAATFLGGVSAISTLFTGATAAGASTTATAATAAKASSIAAAHYTGAHALGTAAEIGAITLGAASLIPSVSQGFGLGGLMSRRRDPEPLPNFDSGLGGPQQSIAMEQAQPRPVMENPDFVPGRGMKAMQQGSCIQGGDRSL